MTHMLASAEMSRLCPSRAKSRKPSLNYRTRDKHACCAKLCSKINDSKYTLFAYSMSNINHNIGNSLCPNKIS